VTREPTVVGTECALSSKVVDEIAEFILHTDLFNCWTCLHVLNQRKKEKKFKLNAICIYILNKLTLQQTLR